MKINQKVLARHEKIFKTNFNKNLRLNGHTSFEFQARNYNT